MTVASRAMGPLVLGRGEQREAIDRLLLATRDGSSGVLVLRGEAGMGKTTLLDYAAASATGLRAGTSRIARRCSMLSPRRASIGSERS